MREGRALRRTLGNECSKDKPRNRKGKASAPIPAPLRPFFSSLGLTQGCHTRCMGT